MSPFATWRPAATSLGEYVEKAGRLEYVRSLAANPPSRQNPNLPGFCNEGGLLDKGVCWWHSRFTRAALYLAWFEPGGTPLDEDGTNRVISTLIRAGGVVSIPGYPNLREFTLDNRELLQRQMDVAQIRDGVFRFQWVNGLAGRSRVPAGRMRLLVDRIHAEVSTEGLAYVKLQVPGMDAHSWIVTEMEPRDGGGYDCRFLDSNQQCARIWEYRPGAERITIAGMGDFGVPYLQRTRELRRMKAEIELFVRRAAGSRP